MCFWILHSGFMDFTYIQFIFLNRTKPFSKTVLYIALSLLIARRFCSNIFWSSYSSSEFQCPLFLTKFPLFSLIWKKILLISSRTSVSWNSVEIFACLRHLQQRMDLFLNVTLQQIIHNWKKKIAISTLENGIYQLLMSSSGAHKELKVDFWYS